MTVVDLNADLGEGFGAWRMGDDEGLLGVVTSANVACGFHAGDPSTMRRVCRIAVERGVAIGAHVSYRDLAGFGRRPMDVPATQLRDELLYQIAALDGMARAEGGSVTYVKAHGALYNRAADDRAVADVLIEAAATYGSRLAVLALPGSAMLAAAAAAGLAGVPEGYLDRASDERGRLVPRDRPGAVITDADQVVARARQLSGAGAFRSLCTHGDTPGALKLTRRVRVTLEGDGVELAAFAPPVADGS